MASLLLILWLLGFIRFMRTFDLIIWLKWALSELHLLMYQLKFEKVKIAT